MESWINEVQRCNEGGVKMDDLTPHRQSSNLYFYNKQSSSNSIFGEISSNHSICLKQSLNPNPSSLYQKEESLKEKDEKDERRKCGQTCKEMKGQIEGVEAGRNIVGGESKGNLSLPTTMIREEFMFG